MQIFFDIKNVVQKVITESSCLGQNEKCQHDFTMSWITMLVLSIALYTSTSEAAKRGPSRGLSPSRWKRPGPIRISVGCSIRLFLMKHAKINEIFGMWRIFISVFIPKGCYCQSHEQQRLKFCASYKTKKGELGLSKNRNKKHPDEKHAKSKWTMRWDMICI